MKNMASVQNAIVDILIPQVLAAEKDFLVIYKPPGMHSAPLAKSSGDNLVNWCGNSFPEIMSLPGRQAGEGGLLHRLDFETQGLMLFARTRLGMEALLEQQEDGKIVKEYSALVTESGKDLPGYPLEKPGLTVIKSAFRPYGPGRKATRPVPGEDYITEILESSSCAAGLVSLRVRILKGFRHQIRCHLAWLGRPILNDSLYGGLSYGKGLLGLRAFSLRFSDPSSGIERNYSIPALGPDNV